MRPPSSPCAATERPPNSAQHVAGAHAEAQACERARDGLSGLCARARSACARFKTVGTGAPGCEEDVDVQRDSGWQVPPWGRKPTPAMDGYGAGRRLGGGVRAVCGGRCAGGVRCHRRRARVEVRCRVRKGDRRSRRSQWAAFRAVGGARVGSGGLGRALNGTCALSGPARAIAGAATVVTPLGSRRWHRALPGAQRAATRAETARATPNSEI